MPFVLHPSGYCAYYGAQGKGNLIPGAPCPYCRRICGHAPDCPDYKLSDKPAASSRPRLYNAAAVLWGKSPAANFITFTLPSLDGGVYQRDADCPETGDLVIASKFSKVVEAWALRWKRAGKKLSYAWVTERQEKRRRTYGGIGDIHYHILANVQIKNDAGEVVDPDLLNSLQVLWCDHLGVTLAKNCIDVRPLPNWIRSVPPYLAKYMGKPTRHPIRARRFGATRDLTEYKPIHLVAMPEGITLETVSEFTTPDGYDITAYYFNTREVLETYGELMAEESLYAGRPGNMSAFTPAAILTRAIKRQRAALTPHLGSSYPT